MPFATEEITGYTIETAKGANEAQKNLPSYFLISVLLFQWLHQLIYLNFIMVLWF